jgi:hypothetical protein
MVAFIYMQLPDAECQKYDETIWNTNYLVLGYGGDTPHYTLNHTSPRPPTKKNKMTIPRRNYFNPQGIVQDASLYPYHDAFYNLIDAYDCLYPPGQEQPIHLFLQGHLS